MSDLRVPSDAEPPMGLAAWAIEPYEDAVQVFMDGPRGRAKTTLGREDIEKILQALVQARNAAWPDEKPWMVLANVQWRRVPNSGAAANYPVEGWETFSI